MRHLRVRLDLQEDVEYILGERGMQQEEENYDCGYAPIKGLLLVASDIQKPEEESATDCDYRKHQVD